MKPTHQTWQSTRAQTVGGALVALALVAVFASAPTGQAATNRVVVAQELDAAYSFAGPAATFGNGQRIGSVTEHQADVRYVISPQLSRDILLRLGAEWERFAFDAPRTAPLPETLQAVSVIIGFDYQIADQWLMRVELQPGIYNDGHDVSGRSLNAPLVLGAAFLKDADTQWFFGLRVDGRSQYPVLPAVGVRWKYAADWTLNLQLPRPRLEYDVNDKVQLYLGVGIEAGTFVVGEHFGDDRGLPQLNRATVDYYEVRVGLGCSWKIHPMVTIEAQAGCQLNRRWDFGEQHISVSSRETPSIQLACHARF